MIPNGSPQHRILRFQSIEDAPQRDGFPDIQCHRVSHLCQCPQMMGQLDLHHASVCTSTESTAGRSRTIGFQ
jgi:hypothetical protein